MLKDIGTYHSKYKVNMLRNRPIKIYILLMKSICKIITHVYWSKAILKPKQL